MARASWGRWPWGSSGVHQGGAWQPGLIPLPRTGAGQPLPWTLGTWRWSEAGPGCGPMGGAGSQSPWLHRAGLWGAGKWPCCSITEAGLMAPEDWNRLLGHYGGELGQSDLAVPEDHDTETSCWLVKPQAAQPAFCSVTFPYGSTDRGAARLATSSMNWQYRYLPRPPAPSPPGLIWLSESVKLLME